MAHSYARFVAIQDCVREIHDQTDARLASEFRRISEENLKELNRMMWESIYNQVVSLYPDNVPQIQVVIKQLFSQHYGSFQEGRWREDYYYVARGLPFILD